MVVAISKASDQPAPRRSLIRAFASRLIILQLLSYGPNTFKAKLGTAQVCLSLHFSKYHIVGNHMPRSKCLYIFYEKQDNMGLELKCILKVKEYLS